jgi:hypothetical protein
LELLLKSTAHRQTCISLPAERQWQLQRGKQTRQWQEIAVHQKEKKRNMPACSAASVGVADLFSPISACFAARPLSDSGSPAWSHFRFLSDIAREKKLEVEVGGGEGGGRRKEKKPKIPFFPSSSTHLCLEKKMPARLVARPSEEELEDIVLSARYGELDELRQVVDKLGKDALVDAADSNGNGPLHMAAGNGHEGVCVFLLLEKSNLISQLTVVQTS